MGFSDTETTDAFIRRCTSDSKPLGVRVSTNSVYGSEQRNAAKNGFLTTGGRCVLCERHAQRSSVTDDEKTPSEIITQNAQSHALFPLILHSLAGITLSASSSAVAAAAAAGER